MQLSFWFAVLALLAQANAANSTRNALFWIVPYGNLTSVQEYENAYAQLRNKPYIAAGSAFALKHDGTLGYANTTAGEGEWGDYMVKWGFPALLNLKVKEVWAMVYVTHEDGISIMLNDPSHFIASLVGNATSLGLQGIDIDYEPQFYSADATQASFMDFVTQLADACAKAKLGLSFDVTGAGSFQSAEAAKLPGVTQINTESTFGVQTTAAFQHILEQNQPAMGAKWAPGFGPAGMGQSVHKTILDYAAQHSVTKLSTWAVHEWNVGPQPQWLFDNVDAFLNAP